MKENKSVVLLNTIVSSRRLCFGSKSKGRNVWGFTQNVVICPPCGESTLKGGKGVVNKATFMDNHPSALCATSPTQGGKSTPRGFTLIELLVVVLIIGILSAVAVPQYKKAVLKSRFSALYPIAQPLAQGQESYYLNQGEYAEDLSALDVSLPGMASGKTAALQDGTQVKLGVEDNHIYVRAEKGNNALMIYQNHSPNFAGETHCEAKLDDDLANWLCDKGLEGTFVGNKYGYAIYSLSEETVGSLARNYYDLSSAKTLVGDNCISTKSRSCQNLNITEGECRNELGYGCLGGTYTRSKCISAEGVSQGCNATFTDHSECITYGSSSCGGTFTNYSKCIDDGTYYSCRGATFKDHSQCIANRENSGCDNRAQFENYSSCVANFSSIGGAGGCAGNTFKDHSVCYGNKNNTCGYGFIRATFTGYSYCVGDASSCKNSNFNEHSYCQANVKGACTGNTYDETSYCTGNYCPDGAPSNTAGKVWYRGTGSEWPDTRESELVDKQ